MPSVTDLQSHKTPEDLSTVTVRTGFGSVTVSWRWEAGCFTIYVSTIISIKANLAFVFGQDATFFGIIAVACIGSFDLTF